ncbi:MAG: TIGR00180 family glycosyltransferase [Candidatus Velthaea sp.]
MPTHNRPRMLARALRHYTSHDVDFPIIVVDTSATEIQTENDRAIAACAARVKHVRCPPDMSVFDKFYSLPELIDTPFAMYMADDDIALLPGVFASLAFLRAHPDFAACHGVYYNAATAEEASLRVGTEYATVSIDLPGPIDRLFALAVRYQAITYAVQRRETFLFARPPIEIADQHFWELFNAFAIAISGKVAALATPYMVRNAQLGAQPDFLGDGNNWVLKSSADMANGYALFRSYVANLLGPYTTKRSGTHLVDLVYLTFLSRWFDVGLITSRLSAEGEISPGAEKILAAMMARSNTAPPPAEYVSAVLRGFMADRWPHFG